MEDLVRRDDETGWPEIEKNKYRMGIVAPALLAVGEIYRILKTRLANIIYFPDKLLLCV